jgi:cysteine-rich repeat protein
VTPAAPRLQLIVPIVALALWCSASATAAPSPPQCGNGRVEDGETCDDGNTNDDDRCPSDCVIDKCTPRAGSRRSFSVSFSPPRGNIVGALSVLVDYPEGRISPVSPVQAGGAITDLPDDAVPAALDFGHALRVIVVKAGLTGIETTQICRIHFEDCEGATAPNVADLTCTVLEATDPLSNPLAGATCTLGP